MFNKLFRASEAQTKIVELTKEIEKLSGENTSLAEQLNALKDSEKNVSEEILDASNYEVELSALKDENERLQKQIENLRVEHEQAIKGMEAEKVKVEHSTDTKATAIVASLGIELEEVPTIAPEENQKSYRVIKHI
jgi:chromosome segregation ATPase